MNSKPSNSLSLTISSKEIVLNVGNADWDLSEELMSMGFTHECHGLEFYIPLVPEEGMEHANLGYLFAFLKSRSYLPSTIIIHKK